jgi:putative ABC transport system permease protein
MDSLAWKNLLHDRVRLAVTLIGIVFALVLIAVQFGLFLGFWETSGNVVAHNSADLWLTSPEIPHVNGGQRIPEKRRWTALAVPGVEKAVNYIIFFVPWKLPTGAGESVQVVGFDLNTGYGGPYNIVAGSVDDLRAVDTVMIDDIYCPKLGVKRVGDSVELNGHRARVVGFTHGLRSFTTRPYVFTSFKNAQNYLKLAEADTIYILLKAATGVDIQRLKQDVQRSVPSVEVFTTAEMARKTRIYWVFGTGAGITTLIGTVLGLLVGVVVVAQTIYASTIDHLREFGTLKAMGASNWVIHRVIVWQALINAVAGYAIGITIAAFVCRLADNTHIAILMPGPVALGILALAVAMCVSAAMLSIRKAVTIDPAMVFRG